MDVTGASFLILTGAEAFTPAEDPDRVSWDEAGACLRLASQESAPALTEDAALAEALRERPPGVMDGFGGLGQVVEVADGEGSSAGDELLVLHHDVDSGEMLPPRVVLSAETITGVAIDDQGFMTAAADGQLLVRDSRTQGEPTQGWQTVDVVRLTGDASLSLAAWRVAPRPGGGAWILDRDQGQLLTWFGKVSRAQTPRDYVPGTFRPVFDDVDTVEVRAPQRGGFDGDTPAGLACSPEGRVVVLGLREDPDTAEALDARLHLFDADGRLLRRVVLLGVTQPYSVAWTDAERVAVLVTHQGSPHGFAIAYKLDVDDIELLPVGETWPLRRHTGSALLTSPDQRAWYPTAGDPRRLVSLSLPKRASAGGAIARTLDSNAAGTVWHRLFMEAVLPEGCGVNVELAASDRPEPPEDPAAWHPHHFGLVPGGMRSVPRAAWQREASEIPHHPGLLGLPRRQGRSGLFGVLVQRQGHKSSALRGRFLFSRLTLHGTGRASPQVAAIRAWTPRLSYVQRYLPELYHEDPIVVAADEPGPATAADFHERFVSLFEGVFTQLEDKVASAWLFTSPETTPTEALPWLASWMGVALEPGMDEDLCRKMIAAAPTLARWRGTRRGLEMALELVTGGGITRGDVVVLEEWRLRRTWATILGVNMAEEEDPLTGAVSVNSNSVVGDTLILGDEHRREFLALFGDEATDGQGEGLSWWERILERIDRFFVDQFFARSAHKASVLVLDEMDAQTLGLVRRIIELEAPAHVDVDVKPAPRNFIAGVSALVGVDTRVGVEPPPRVVRLGHSRLGAGDRIRRPPGLHPELEGEGG
ncbi:MAG: phage tail protein [Alphaproteobacteria bacterium]|nr:phage tail protein [Alphaproteobacteria bacterium]